MNTNLLLFLVLLCFPAQSAVYAATGKKISGSKRNLGRSKTDSLMMCGFAKMISGGKYNCSKPASAVTTAANTDDTMPDVSADKFIINLFVGGSTTPQSVSLVLDTTLDYTFMLCKPCSTDSCSTDLTEYNPSLSDTFSNYTCTDSDCPSLQDYVSCSGGFCMYNYTDYESVTSKGPLGKDTFNLNSSPFPFVFGCGEVNTGNYGSSLGILGLGSGGLSLLSQTKFGKFSYCFGSSGTGAFLWGTNAQLYTSLGASTQLLRNELVPNFHYVNFTGVSLGGEKVDIPTSAYLPQPDGTGGMLLTSTYAYTYLEESVYYALKDVFVTQMGSITEVDASDYGLDLCFAIPTGGLTFPQLTLHLNGADMSGYYFGTNSDETVGCLLLLPIQGISVLGYVMQYDTQMIYDVGNGMLHFEPIDCSTL